MGTVRTERRRPASPGSCPGIFVRKRSLLTAASFMCLVLVTVVVQADEKRAITGYGPFDFSRTVTPSEVEKAGGDRISVIHQGSIYAYRAAERFEGLIDFQRYHEQGKIPPARQSGYVPKINAAELRLEDSKLWLIVLYFDPHEFNEYLRIIKLEYGEPSARPRPRAATGELRKAVWLRGGNCLVLQQVAMGNTLNGGQLEIVKDRCEDVVRR